MNSEDFKHLPQDPVPEQRQAIRNLAYDDLKNHLVVGYQQAGPDYIIAVVQKDSGATSEQIKHSWEEFDKRRLEYDPYKCTNVGPLPLHFSQV